MTDAHDTEMPDVGGDGPAPRLGPAPGALSADEELRAAALRAANRRVSRIGLGWFFEWAESFPAAIALFLVLRAFLVEAFKIPSGSMESTLLVGDFLLVNKLVYGAEVPFTGDAPARGARAAPRRRGGLRVARGSAPRTS